SSRHQAFNKAPGTRSDNSTASRFLGLFSLVLNRLRGFGSIVFADALLEALDALGNITHQFGDLAAPEQHEHDHKDDQPVPNTKGTHNSNSYFCLHSMYDVCAAFSNTKISRRTETIVACRYSHVGVIPRPRRLVSEGPIPLDPSG